MAVTWTECVPDAWPRTGGEGGSGLRLVEEGNALPAGLRRRGVPLEVRRRRTLFVVMAGLLLALALPLSGTGGYSHPAGSAPAENVRPVVYTARPGDTLWTIAERLDPTGDPRPLVAQLEAQTGSDTVQTGERITVP
jgi:hypothetical protein